MVYLSLLALSLGLVLGVIAMLVGVEKRQRSSASRIVDPAALSREAMMAASSEISARFHLPIVAPFATVFGTVGYILIRYSSLGSGVRILVSTLAGAAAAAGAVILIARWAIPSARRDIPDERYLWQGLPATVIAPIHPGTPGHIRVEVDGTRHAVLAVSLYGEPIELDADVVIERIEGGTAFVEPWAAVERRL